MVTAVKAMPVLLRAATVNTVLGNTVEMRPLINPVWVLNVTEAGNEGEMVRAVDRLPTAEGAVAKYSLRAALIEVKLYEPSVGGSGQQNNDTQ